jgi:hypothetical protein
MGLEDFLYGSKNVRDYLKLFSEQQWNRLCKATMMLGIQYLANLTGNNLRTLSVKDIEDIVGKLSLQSLISIVDMSLQQAMGQMLPDEAAALLIALKKRKKDKKKKRKIAKERKQQASL